MLRKTIHLASLLSLSITNTAFASFYVGIGTGIDTANFSQHARVINPFTNVIDNQNKSGKGVYGTLFAGYGWSCKQLYLAGELNLNSSSLGNTTANISLLTHTVSHTTFQITNSMGISVLPGILVSDSAVLYGRFGYAKGHFKAITTDTSLEHKSVWLDGFRVGLGISQVIYKNVALRLEYNQIRYSDVNMFATPDITRKTTTITPVTNQFELGIDYQFC